MILYLCIGMVLLGIMGAYTLSRGKKDGEAGNDIRKTIGGRTVTIFDKNQKKIFTILLLIMFIAPQIIAHIFLSNSHLWRTGQGFVMTLTLFLGCWNFYLAGADDAATEKTIERKVEQYRTS